MNETTGNLSDKTFLVTGASRGLGLALAAAAGAAGARVVLTARGEARLRQAVADLCRRGCAAHAIAADVSDLADAQRVAAEAAALAGPVDVLVHNASTLGATPMPV